MTKEERSSHTNSPEGDGAPIRHPALGHFFIIRISSSVIVVFSSLLLFWCGCAGPHAGGSRQSRPHLVGKIAGNSYISSEGHFSVPSPVSPDEDGRVVRDDAQSVTFHDKMGSKISFYSRPFNAQSALMSPPQSEARAKALETFMKDIYGNSIVPHYHPDILDGTLSFIQLKLAGPKVGVATFIRQNRIYLVETDLLPAMEFVSESELPEKDRETWLENRAMELLQSMEIK